ncbi:MAG TPA: glycosyltransferase family 39 protein [Caulobacterales bacterium]|nr:glycosyltransferase family 39 protein [Caulobacterales bacterium]
MPAHNSFLTRVALAGEAPGAAILDRAWRWAAHGWRAYVVIACLSLCASLPGLVATPPLDRDESRFAQSTAQMLESGDFVRIRLQEEARNKKPIGIYWMQAASVAMFSSPSARAIWAYRLPSLLGALVAALGAFWGGAALIGRRAALLGAALLATSVLLSTEGMIAKTDAAMTGATVIAMAALARLSCGSRSRGLVAVFWAALAVGALIKGPVTPMVAVLCLGSLALWERRAAWMKVLLWPPAIALALLILAPWLIAIETKTQGQFLRDSVGGDLGRKMVAADNGHAAPPGYYLLLLPFLAFPITAGLIDAAELAWRTVRAPRTDAQTSGVRFLLCWAAPTWLVFELMPTKLAHYTLPTYPAIALIAGAGLASTFAGRTPKRLARGVFTGLVAAALVALCAFLATLDIADQHDTLRVGAETAMLVTLVMLPFFVFLCRARSDLAATAAAVAMALVFAVTARGLLLPQAHRWMASEAASEALQRAGLHPRLNSNAGRLVAVGYNEPSFVFLTRTDTLLADPQDAARAAAPGAAFIVEGRDLPALTAALSARGLSFAPIGPPVSGVNYSNHLRPLSLQPGRIVPARTEQRTQKQSSTSQG